MNAVERDWVEEWSGRVADTTIASHGTRFVEVSRKRVVHGTLAAEARALHAGRTTVVIQSTVKDDARRLIATVTATQIVPRR
jgi:acyl-coenzyme A thioesterase PaaI-like protein